MGPHVSGSLCAGLLCDGSFCDGSFSDGTLWDLGIHSHLYSFALRFLFLQLTPPLTVSTVQLLYTVKENLGKPDREPYPLPYGLRNP
jgi:hypothetical protein